MQSIGEAPALQPPSGSPHGRPSIAGLSTETLDAEDGVTGSTFPSVDSSTTKSLLAVGGGEHNAVSFR